MFFQIRVSLSRISLKFERHAPTLQHGKSRVYRHNAEAERRRPASEARAGPKIRFTPRG
jgi:hypothetical protein